MKDKTRTDLQRLAEMRVEEARTLLDAGHYSGAYYLSGYAVECGLKACIAKLTVPDLFPRKDSNQYYIHAIETLVGLADLAVARKQDRQADPDLETAWNVAKSWTVDSRYDEKTQQEAREMYEAVAHPDHGVLQWLKARW